MLRRNWEFHVAKKMLHAQNVYVAKKMLRGFLEAR